MSSHKRTLIPSSTFAALLLLAGCADSTAPPVESLELGPLVFPAVDGPAEVYERETPHSGYEISRFILYPDSAFAYQSVRRPGGLSEYAGSFARSDSAIAFDFDRTDATGQWEAGGEVEGTRLAVQFSVAMSWFGFEDGIYVVAAEQAAATTSAIHIGDAYGSDARVLTDGQRPAWAPDGRRITFHRVSEAPMAPGEQARQGRIYVIDVDGTSETALGHGIEPSWSPDGDRIVFTTGEGIAVMDADGTRVSTVLRHDAVPGTNTPSNLGVGKPVWSPDGESIAFEHRGDGEVLPAQIYVMAADGSDPRRLTPTEGIQYAESDPAWSPDGTRVVFWSYGYGIATVSVGGGWPATVFMEFPTVAYGAKPVWSPDGVSVAFTARVGDGRQIWTRAGDRPLVANARHAVWSPDGRRLAFVRPRSE